MRAAVPLRQPLFAGYRLSRSVAVVQARNPGRLTRGDVLRVTLTVDATAERNWVVVSDPVPAGATVVGGLANQSQMLGDQPAGEGAQPSYVERGRDAWRAYFGWLPRGRTSGQLHAPSQRRRPLQPAALHGRGDVRARDPRGGAERRRVVVATK